MKPRFWTQAIPYVAMAIASACGGEAAPRPQWTVSLATDAPVPGFGDQVLVEVLDGSAAPQTNLIDASSGDRWPISFGVVPANVSTPVSLRVRLFRTSTTGSDGFPASTAIIDETGVLPPIAGVTSVGLVLAMNCFGVAPSADGTQTCNPVTGQLAPPPVLGALTSPPVVGSWAPAARVDCNGTAPPGMACVPGGAFILGSPTFYATGTALDPTPEHVVELAPFAIDLAEVTVGQIRPLVQQGKLVAPATIDNFDGLCTYLGANDASNDGMPADCLPWAAAQQACGLLGANKRLPTEAEWEFAAGNESLETTYPWGSDSNICAYAVVARGQGDNGEPTNCIVAGTTTYSPGPAIESGQTGDVTLSLQIQNLGGNVGEWVDDVFAPYDAPFWTGAPLLVNPDCQQGVDGGTTHSTRGGSFIDYPYLAGVFYRNTDSDDNGIAALGFRCAQSM